jgi:hypothetical protein
MDGRVHDKLFWYTLYLMFTYGGTVTVRSASFRQDQTQFRAHRHFVTCKPGTE